MVSTEELWQYSARCCLGTNKFCLFTASHMSYDH
ncbi:unnamed protein product [Dracunculus medinensis]|uniref:Uncharacterized protein n=1 Tax=Dracunculus medinensis TaxID=318479 RepID=A0A0N4UF10_DRAME|nr:unnamed protein product [Dracunculus medinensis]